MYYCTIIIILILIIIIIIIAMVGQIVWIWEAAVNRSYGYIANSI